jgi:putative ABC transport system permease protein
MLISDLLEETFFAISANKVRSGLTILGIVIGIGSVIVMIAIGQGATGSIEASIQSMGSNLITVSPGAQKSFSMVRSQRGTSTTLTENDAQAIFELSGVEAIAPQLSNRYQLVYKGNNTNTQVVGTTDDYLTVRNITIASGSFISDLNNESASKVVVLGPTVSEDLFGEDVDPVGKTIKINKISFKVIGVTASKGSSGMGGSQDDMVFVPLSAMEKFLVGNEYLSTLSVQAESEKVMDTVAADITDLLLVRHEIIDVTAADFTVQSQEDMLESASSISDTLTILLAAIASISLVVGGIGIMNMMMTTVTERTREIGLRKAIGAKRKDISLQFLIEATMLTFIGGILGVILGVAIAWGLDIFGLTDTKISLFSVFLAFGVSAAIGIAFGYWPARQASKLNPIEALRYE